MKEISVIMPLFNAQKYLPEALQSVLNQTYKDFELICIDDCSADGTRSILEEFQKKDARVRIMINKKHLGAAPSRNKGLKAAQGKYVLFLDGDDVFEEELFEKADSAMEKYQADIVLFEYLHVPTETIYVKKTRERSIDFSEKYCQEPFEMCDYQPSEFIWWADSPCNRMLRRDFLEQNELEFQNLPSSNDVYFAQMALFCAKRIICLDDRRVMVYARDHLEPQRISNQRTPMCAYYAMETVCKELKERNMIGRYASYLYHRLPTYFIYVLTSPQYEKYNKDFYDFLHKEGILKCLEYGKEYWEQFDEYDKYLLECFLNNTYESRWFEHLDTYFQLYLKKRGGKIREFIGTESLKNKKIVLWGVGVNGKILLDYLEEYSVKIAGIVDCDMSKQGRIVNGYEIFDPAICDCEADYIIVTSKQLSQEVRVLVRNPNIRVIDLLNVLTDGQVDL